MRVRRKPKKPKVRKRIGPVDEFKEELKRVDHDIPIFGIKKIKIGGQPRRVTKEAERNFLENVEGQRNLIKKSPPRRET